MKELNDEQLEAVRGLTEYVGGMLPLKQFLKKKGLIKEEFEAGKWYKSDSGSIALYQGDNISTYGFQYTGKWLGGSFWFNHENIVIEKATPATDKEVEAALIKEAKKLIEKGVVKCLHECDDIYSMEDVKYFEWSGRCLRVHLKGGCCCIFDGGKWATIIEEPKEIVVNGITYIEK